MVSFVSVEFLKPGMILARDIYGVDKYSSQIIMLRTGQKLTQKFIEKLNVMEIPGVYIKDNNEYDKDYQVVKRQTKKEVLDNIKQIYDLSTFTTTALYSGAISNANDVLEKLIDTIVQNPNMYIDLSSLRLYDDYTYNHSMGVTVLSIAIGKAIGLRRRDLAELALCALLHDIGKMQVPIDIISKPSRLTDDEYDSVKEHVVKGGQILKDKDLISQSIFEGVLSHHEKYDGSGYPNGLKGKDIPLFGRIVSCADVYDALTSKRPYRTPTSPSESIEYIMGGTGVQFDRGIVKGFLKCISPYPIGSCVVLSNGMKGVIVEQNTYSPLRPVICLMDDPTEVIDLFSDKKYLGIVIKGNIE